ncbi:MAG: DNA cytosine methyltransferase [Solirubrobacteraceae bacterium]|nr:DNA cytosine methyltransferase [Solirubrobacteraceae bacterium]
MITFHDMFCGAGGSTLGAVIAGAQPVVGMNHWPIACESYGNNHPDARVDCADVMTVDPRRYPRADLLLASPECTHHSYARGRPKDDPNLFDPDGDQGAERSRATMWDVVRFTEFHHYDAVIVENVPAATKWGGRQGQRLKHDEYGVLFSAWLHAMDGLGYDREVVHLNSMVCGVPQSRDRIYVVFWRRGARRPDLDIRPVSWCTPCGRLVRGRQQWKRAGSVRGNYDQSYVYACSECHERVAPVITPAAAAIDWSLPATRISDRARPLKPATMQRIRRGLDRLSGRPPAVTLAELLAGGPAADPDGLVLEVGGQTFERPSSGYARAWPTDEPFKTQHASTARGLVVAAGGPSREPRPTHQPVGALLRRETHALVVPTTHGKGGDRARSPLGPMLAQTGRQEQAIVVSNMTNNVPRLADSEPAATVTCGNKLGVAIAPGAGASVGEGGGQQMAIQIDLRGANAPRPMDGAPLSTIAARGQHHGFVVANYSPGWMRPADERELGTLTTTDSHALLTYRGTGDVRGVGEPVSTIATIAEHALLSPQIAVEDCGFRMLEPGELKLASGFGADYALSGSKRDQVAQIGNAVTAPAETELVARVIEAIG